MECIHSRTRNGVGSLHRTLPKNEGVAKKSHVQMLRIAINHENQGKYMIMVLVSDGASCLPGYSDRRKMHTVFKLSVFSLGLFLQSA